jgi:ComF family protein
MWRDLIRTVLDLVYPVDPVPDRLPELRAPFCEVCGEPFFGVADGPFRCANCLGRRWSLLRARAPYRSVDEVRKVIHEFKYGGAFHHRRLLISWICQGYDRFYAESGPYHALVPVPLYPLRRRDRGFNQAEELAAGLSEHCGVPVRRLLRRVRSTETQTRLRRSERLKNQKGAYEFLKTKFDVTGARLLIIDDVFTTGATVDACARVLRGAGASEVSVLTVARG